MLQVAEMSDEIFFPPSNSGDMLVYDCLPKTINQALRFPFFTHRDQIIRLMKFNLHVGG